ncbi:MAG: vWA domain-containing protein [Candidatus Nanopelagicales bacterium]
MAESPPRNGSARLPDIVAAFGHVLHSAGVPVTPERSARFGTVVTLARPATADELYWLGRVTLVTDHAQVETYDAVFRQVFQGIIDMADFRGDSPAPPPPAAAPSGERTPGDPQRQGEAPSGPHGTSATPGERSPDDSDEDDEPSALAAVSQEERLASKDFAACTEEELALIRRLVDRLPLVPPLRRGRRSRRHPAGARLDVRQTLRRAHRTAGDPVDLVRRRRTRRPRRVVLIADVSGSMEPYARVYLHLMRGAVHALHAEAFVFATRLTRLTRPLSMTHPDIAYRTAIGAAPDWAGGTRIGRALLEFVESYGRRGVARGAVVVIVSDGWEIEDPAMVGEAMARLSRLAHHVVWVNPRKAGPSYEPLVGGMAAALPFIDTFVSGHSVRSLEEVMAAISGAVDRSAGPSRAVG